MIWSRPRVEVLTSVTACEAILPEWESLWRRDPLATPFQAPAWLLAWWRHFPAGDLRVGVVRTGGRLTAVLAAFRVPDLENGARLALLGSGTSDYLDVTLDPAQPESVDELLEGMTGDEALEGLDFEELRGEARLLDAGVRRAHAREVCVQSHCHCLPLPARVEELRDVLSPGLADHLDCARRRAARMGRLEFLRADAASFDELFDDFVELHVRRWRGRGVVGVDAGLAPFLRDAGRGLLASGTLVLGTLRWEGQPLAAMYALRHHRRFCYFLGGFDPAQAQLSPGTLMVGRMMEEAIRSGSVLFDFLRGDEPYKARWGAVPHPNHRVRWRLAGSAVGPSSTNPPGNPALQPHELTLC